MDSSTESDEILLHLFLRFNRRLMAIVYEYPQSLSVQQSQVLTEIASHPGITAVQLGAMLNLEKSILSRTLKTLEAKKLIKRSANSSDARAKVLTCTSLGEREALNDRITRNKMADECAVPLSATEQTKLNHYLNRMADSLNAAPISVGSEDSPTKISIRRLTRSMGFLGGNFLGSGLSIEQFQLLYIIGKADDPVLISHIREVLPYDAVTISNLIGHFVRLKAIKRTKRKEDKREAQLNLTSVGAILFQKSISSATVEMTRSLSSLSTANKNELISILREFLGDESKFARSDLKGRALVLPLLSEQQRRQARAFVIEELVRSGTSTSAPARLLEPPHSAYTLLVDGEVHGVLESIKKDKIFQYSLFLTSPTISSELREKLVRTGMELSAGTNKSRVIKNHNFPGSELLETILNKKQ